MSVFSIGTSGLSAAQRALQNTANNISNVNTDGYNRELANMAEMNGSGVKVEKIERQFDRYVAGQLQSATSSTSSLEVFNNQMAQLDRLLADSDSGLAPITHSFFSSLRDLASVPSDAAARQGVLGTAATLASQYRSFDQHINSMRLGIDGQMATEVDQINIIAEEVAVLNKEIIIARARTGSEPNSLLNLRDNLVTKLNEHIGARLYVQDGGTYNISLPDGRALVAGENTYKIAVADAAADDNLKVISYTDGAGNVIELPESSIKGGNLGGLFEFRTNVLDPTQDRLGRMAATLAQTFNDQHALGTDANGLPGGEFFQLGTPTLIDNRDNVGAPAIDVQFDDTSNLKALNYNMRVINAAAGDIQFQDTDGNVQTLTLDGLDQITIDGVLVTVTNRPGLVDGDRFLMRPTRVTAGVIDLSLSDVAEIAASQGGGTGDNRNALAMQDIQIENIVDGLATLSGEYASLVGQVGNTSSVAQVNLSVQASLKDQIKGVEQSVSGVNLDEEAANLIRYQQFYQANAKVIQTATVMLDTILNIR